MPEASVVDQVGSRCPSCGTMNPPGQPRCKRCQSPLPEREKAGGTHDILTDIGELMTSLGDGGGAGGAPERRPVPIPGKDAAPLERQLPERVPEPPRLDRRERWGGVEERPPGRPPPPEEPDREEEVRVERPDAKGEENYQCLICGSTIPAEADKCPVCGTIFVSESEAQSFRGIPVARIPRQGEIEAGESDLRQTAAAHEEVRVEPPPPRAAGPGQIQKPDVLPVLESGPPVAPPAARPPVDSGSANAPHHSRPQTDSGPRGAPQAARTPEDSGPREASPSDRHPVPESGPVNAVIRKKVVKKVVKRD